MAERMVSGIATSNDGTYDLIEEWSVERTTDGYFVRVSTRDVRGKAIRVSFDLFKRPRLADNLAITKK